MATKKNIIVGAARIALGPAINPAADPAVPGASNPATIRATGTAAQWTHFAFDPATHYATTTDLTTWRDVGFTQDGLEVATDPSFSDVEVDQLLDAPKIFQDGMGFTVSTTFAEATLENLLVAWGQSDTYVTNTATTKEVEIDGGALGRAPLERGLVAVGNAPEQAASNAYGERTYFIYRVMSVDAASHTLSRAEAVTVPVSFRALPADNGKYGSIRDRLNVSAV